MKTRYFGCTDVTNMDNPNGLYEALENVSNIVADDFSDAKTSVHKVSSRTFNGSSKNMELHAIYLKIDGNLPNNYIDDLISNLRTSDEFYRGSLSLGSGSQIRELDNEDISPLEK